MDESQEQTAESWGSKKKIKNQDINENQMLGKSASYEKKKTFSITNQQYSKADT